MDTKLSLFYIQITNNTSNKSEHVGYSYSSFLYSLAFTLQLVLGCVGLAGNTFFIALLWQFRQLHRNIRLLLISVSSAALILSGSYVARSLVFILKSSESTFKSSFPFYVCVLLDTPIYCCLSNLIFSILALVVERAIATKRLGNYNSSTGSKLVFIALTLVWIAPLVLIAFIHIMLQISGKNNALHTKISYCNGIISLVEKAQFLAYFTYSISFSAEILTLALILTVLRKNRQILENFFYNRAHLNLASRVQLKHTIEVTQMIIPSTVLHMVTYFTHAISLIIRNSLMHTSATSILLSEYCDYSLLSLFGAFHPFLCMANYAEMRQELVVHMRNIWKLKCTTRNNSNSIASSANAKIKASVVEGDERIEMLSQMWNKKYRKKHRKITKI